MIPSIGRIVHIRLSAGCAKNINMERSNLASHNKGNSVKEGDIFPMIITKLWTDDPNEFSAVNGQIFLDGNDIYHATSVTQGDSLGQWFEPTRI